MENETSLKQDNGGQVTEGRSPQREWKSYNVAPEVITAISQQLRVSTTFAKVLHRLGFREPDDVQAFLNPRLRDLRDPFEVGGVREAIDRIRAALARDEDIVIYGDYDVDGVTSTVFLTCVLRQFGARPRYVVPRRLEEGYGLSDKALERVLEDGVPNLLIAVDCGTNSKAEVAALRSRGTDVIIIDHHTSREDLPEDCVLVNPHVLDGEGAPWMEMCSVGLVFKVVHALLKDLREEGDATAFHLELKDYLDLVAMGTIADLVPLHEENRILARNGLRRLANSKRMGLTALLEACGISPDQEMSPFDISFKLGPRINASGRLDDALLPIDMLLCEDWLECTQAARDLNDFNRERQTIEREIFEQADAQVQRLNGAAGYVLYGGDWHPGVVGIVASRIVQKYHRPAIVLGAEGGMGRGSGRSIRGVNLVCVLQACDHLLEEWGGHPMAVGVSVDPKHIADLQRRFSAAVLEHMDGDMPDKVIDIIDWITPADLNKRLLEDLERLHPYGQANPEPVFALRGVEMTRPVQPFGENHFRFLLPGPQGPISGVAWKLGDRPPPPRAKIDMAVKFAWNCWNGRRQPQITLIDWRMSG